MSGDKKATEPPLLAECNGAVETIIINDPPRNRLSLEFMDALEVEIARVAHDPGVRALVIRGASEENFSVGMDLKQLSQGVARMGSLEAVLDQRLRVLSAIENLPKPAVAVLYGYCLGGGLELPLACHFRLAAAEGAKIGLPELDLGTVPAWGGSARLSRCVGQPRDRHDSPRKEDLGARGAADRPCHRSLAPQRTVSAGSGSRV